MQKALYVQMSMAGLLAVPFCFASHSAHVFLATEISSLGAIHVKDLARSWQEHTSGAATNTLLLDIS